MPETAEQIYDRCHDRLIMPDVAEWDTFPFAGVLGVRPLEAPLEAEPRIKELFDDLTALGHKPFPIPLGVQLNKNDPSAAPYKPSNFDGADSTCQRVFV